MPAPLDEQGGISKLINFRAAESDHAIYRQAAASRNMNLSEFLREALYEYLSASERKELVA